MRFVIKGLVFRVWCFVFGVSGLGCRVWGVGLNAHRLWPQCSAYVATKEPIISPRAKISNLKGDTY